MRFVKSIIQQLPIAFMCFCVATTVVQSYGAAVLWSAGALTPDKLTRYSAVLYGLDLTELPPGEGDENVAEPTELMSREERIESRAKRSELMADRESAVKLQIERARVSFEEMRSDNDRFEQLKAKFDAYLAQEEAARQEEAIQEVERTLAILPPRQSKDLILRMLEDQEIDPTDNILDDVVTMFQSMPRAKLKKILGEFKTEPERRQLHEIISEIGQIDERS